MSGLGFPLAYVAAFLFLLMLCYFSQLLKSIKIMRRNALTVFNLFVNFIFCLVSVTCSRSVVFSGY